MLPIEGLGDNGGGFFNANGAHPFQIPNPVTSVLYVWLLLMLPFAFPWTFGKMIGSMRQGMVVLTAMGVLFLIGMGIVLVADALHECVDVDRDPRAAVIWFSRRMMDRLGYAPQLHECVGCERHLSERSAHFSAASGGLLMRSPIAGGLLPGRNTFAELSQRESRARERVKFPAPQALTA